MGKDKIKTSKKLSVARYLVSRIEELGIDLVPVIQGGAIMKMIDEVGESKKLQYICPNHEQTLAMMVDAYARINGFGVGMTTSGPGGVNLATGIACSYYDSIPCLYITGQVGMFHVTGNRKVRQRGFQETNIPNVLREITKYAKLIEKVEDVRFIFEEALYFAKSGRPGPVVIDLPYNIQREIIVPETLKCFVPNEKEVQKVNLNELERIMGDLFSAERPLLLVGGGVRMADQVNNIRTLVRTIELPTVTTWGAADIFGYESNLYLGNVGKSGNLSAINAVQECDLLISLGCRFTPKIIINEKIFAKQAKIIAFDIDSSELNEGLINPAEKIICDLRYLIPRMISEIMGRKINKLRWTNYLKEKKQKEFYINTIYTEDKKYVCPNQFTTIFFEEAPENAVFLFDAGANLTWAMQASKLKEGQRIISAWGNSPMGYSFSAGIGAWLANPNTPVFVFIGDGGFQMNIQEMQTMKGNNISIKTIIFNNKCYGNIVMGARREFNERIHGNDHNTGYTTPDFIKIAKAYGIQNMHISSSHNLRKRIQKIIKFDEALLVNLDIDPQKEHIEFDHTGFLDH